MIEIDVSRARKRFSVDVKFSMETHGITTLFGPSGSGKSTLIDLIAGLLKADRGHISLGGRTLYDSETQIDLPPERRRLGYVFQDARLFPHMTARANLRYGMRRHPLAERRLREDDVIDLLGLGHLLARRPAQLSGGERQRVAIGRALLVSPDLLLMDEPLASLDQPRKNEILPFIRRLPRELDMPVIYVSHALEEVIRLSDRVVVLTEGNVRAAGEVEDILSRPDLAPYTGRFWAGAVIRASVEGHDGDYALTRLAFSGGGLLVARLDHPIGAEVRIRVRSRDVSLALSPPTDSSILNAIPCVVREIATDDTAQADIVLDAGGTRLLARITRKSVDALGLAPGVAVYAMIKAVSVERPSVERAEPDNSRESHASS
ncbi:MAG: molybdenum ABC transporter ATP-binding protein [Alphaproteobacteria bacterium]|nr:molybdenum ABC transporter ATP-binding protein [Alphaproteobacteria bacterium]